MSQKNSPAPTTLDATTGAPLAEISQEPPAMEVFLDQHQMKIIFLAILLALGSVGYVVYSGIEKGTAEAAGARLVAAEDSAELKKVVSEFAGTPAAMSAKILIAEDLWDNGEKEKSVEFLEKFLVENSSHPAIASAQTSLGSKLITLGKEKEAEQTFNDVVDNPQGSYLAPFALIKLGDIAAKRGDAETAHKQYKLVGKDYPESLFNNMATTRSLLLMAKAPRVFTEIKKADETKEVDAPADVKVEAEAKPPVPSEEKTAE